MADKFECDQCGTVFDMTEKAGRMTLEEIRWNGGIQFPPIKLATHDLCKGCMAVAKAPRLKRPVKTRVAKVEDKPKQLNEPALTVIDIQPTGPDKS